MDASYLAREIETAARRKLLSGIELFRDYDPSEQGTVSLNVFYRILSMLNVWMERTKLERCIQGFATPTTFRYREFFDRVKPADAKQHLSEYDLCQINNECKVRGINLKHQFELYDPHQIGRIPVRNFLTALNFTILARKALQVYQIDSSGYVDYKLLISDLDEAPTKNPKKVYPCSTFLPECLGRVAPILCPQIQALREQFRTTDRFSKMIVPQPVFFQIISQFGVFLDKGDILQVIKAYRDPETDEIKYYEFLDHCEMKFKEYMDTKVFKSIEVNNTDYIVERLKNRLNATNSRVAYELSSGPSVLPTQDFFRHLQIYSIYFQGPEYQAVCERFSAGENLIDVAKFLEEIFPTYNQVTYQEIIERLKDHLAKKQLTLRHKLRRLDDDHDGKIPHNVLFVGFRSVLFDASIKEQNVIVQTLGRSIDIESFCDEVDPYIAPKELPPIPDGMIDWKTRSPRPARTPGETVCQILGKINYLSEVFRIDLMYEFRAYDRMRHGTVSSIPFENVLVQRFEPHLTLQEVKELEEYYKAPKPGEVYYEEMVVDMEKSSAPLTQTQRVALNQSRTINFPVSERLSGIHMRLRRGFHDQKTDIADVFHVYDNTQREQVHISRFEPILALSGVKLTRDEINELTEAYRDQRLPEYINYRLLCEDVNACHVENVKQQETALPGNLVEILQSTKSRLVPRYRDLLKLYAHMPDTIIPIGELQSRLAACGVHVDANSLVQLNRYYSANERNDIDWTRFATDISKFSAQL